jgi:hypothetical protein
MGEKLDISTTHAQNILGAGTVGVWLSTVQYFGMLFRGYEGGSKRERSLELQPRKCSWQIYMQSRLVR